MKKAIFGLGKSGVSVIKYLNKQAPESFYVINRGNPDDWELNILKDRLLNEDVALKYLDRIEEIILSPGIPLTHPLLVEASKQNIKIISEIEFAFQRSTIPLIAITGSNGKTTVAMMISELLELHGKKIFIGGNIGNPYTEILSGKEYDYAVIEVSSFQLETIDTFAPVVSIITNITSGHTERYETHSLYMKAKLNITQKSKYNLIGDNELKSLNIKDARLYSLNETYNYNKSELIGKHNFINFSGAIEVVKYLLKNEFQMKLGQKLIDTFKGARFRCEKVYDTQGLAIFNDGKSTSIEATLAALDSVGEAGTLLIISGKVRSDSIDISSLLCRDVSIAVYGDASKLFTPSGKVSIFNTLEEVIDFFQESRFSKLLFSPGFPSFDLYDNYEQRALAFDKEILRLK